MIGIKTQTTSDGKPVVWFWDGELWVTELTTPYASVQEAYQVRENLESIAYFQNLKMTIFGVQ